MRITDAQVHIITRHSPSRPWAAGDGVLHGWREYGADKVLAEMDRVGVDRAVVVPTSTEGDRNDTSLAAADAHPDRFAVMGRIDLADPASREALSTWRQTPGMLGIRLTFRRGASLGWLDDGTADWFWPAAEETGIPVYIHVPGLLDRVPRIAEGHPRLRLVIDHLGMSAEVRPDQVICTIEQVINLASLANVAVKASALPCVVPEPYPFPSLHGPLERLLDAFGPRRVFWGSDITRLPCSYAQCVAMFTEELSFLSGEDLEWVMGRAVSEWLGWP